MLPLVQKVKDKFQLQGGFFKSVSILVGGTAFAQALSVLILPIITRLYNPDDFALFAVYSSILGILSVAACLRFEIAIPIPKKNKDALSLFILAIVSNVFFTLVLTLIIFLFHVQIIGLIQQPKLKPFLWLIPVGVFFAGLYNALQYWTTRNKQFSTIAKTRMTQSIASSTAQIGGGCYGFGAVGLIIGQIINFSAGIVRLAINFWRESSYLFKKISITRLKVNWKRYDKFPKYSTFEALAHIMAIELPVVIIAAVATGAEAGYLVLAMKVMAIPITLIGGAVAQVYLAHASESYNEGKLRTYTIQTIKKIALIALVPLLTIGMMAPFMFPILFGEEWSRAGSMVTWMTPWFAMQILSSPVSMSLHVTGNQKFALLLQIMGLVIRVGGLIGVSLYYSKWVFEYYALSGFIFYILYLFVIMRILKLGEVKERDKNI
jgi:O-antigen/teichoic acid export membrane protein